MRRYRSCLVSSARRMFLSALWRASSKWRSCVVVLLVATALCGTLLYLYIFSTVSISKRAVETRRDLHWEADDSTVTTPRKPRLRTTPLGPPISFVTPHASLHHDFPYRYLINEPHLCDKQVFILNMVPVATAASAERHRIRALWGNWTVVASTGMRTVFVLGMTSSYHDQRNIEQESHTYHDIIQMNFIDSYHNLTLKTLTMLHWKLMYCPLAAWLLKSDDDVFVNPFTLKRVLADHHRASFLCRIQYMLKVCRPSMNCPRKWAVSPADYQHDKYPPYCLGSFYLISSSMAEVVFAAANKTHPFVLEDVYITGIVAQPYKPRYINLEDRMQIYVTRFNEAFWDGRVLFCLFKERVRNASSYALWDKIVDYNRAMHVPAPQ